MLCHSIHLYTAHINFDLTSSIITPFHHIHLKHTDFSLSVFFSSLISALRLFVVVVRFTVHFSRIFFSRGINEIIRHKTNANPISIRWKSFSNNLCSLNWYAYSKKKNALFNNEEKKIVFLFFHWINCKRLKWTVLKTSLWFVIRTDEKD